MMIEPKENVTNIENVTNNENVTNIENVTSDQNNMLKQVEKVSNNQQIAFNQNLNEVKTTESSPSVFKLEARRNFNAILKQVETEKSGLSSHVISNLPSTSSGSQQLRIVNSKITSIENVIPSEPSIEPKKPKLVIANESFKFKKEDNHHVFTYNPLNVESDSLHCIDYSYVKEGHVDPRNKNSMLNLAEENTNVYRCYLCPYFNVQPDMIAQHWVLVHLPQKVYECPHCDQCFQTNFEVLCHLKLSHPLDNHRVMIKFSDHFKNRISFDFRKNLYIKETEVEENDDKNISFKIKCHKCGLNCQSLIHLEEHLKQRHIHFKPFVCHLCYPPIAFNVMNHLESHVEQVHPGYTFFDKNKTVAQNVYDMTFDTSNTLFCVGIYLNCINCPYKTISKGQMIFHLINKHDCPSKVICKYCLFSHNLTLTEIEAERVVCRCCSSITNLHFRMPPRKEEKDSLYGCTVCNINLNSKMKILRHLKFVHSNWKPFGCGYCDYAAVEKREVKCHLAVLHPSEPEKVVQLEEADSKMRKILTKMFDKMVKIIPKPLTPEVFECTNCEFKTKIEKDLSTHMLHKHHLRKPLPVRLPTEFYRCIICNYRCLDRSCMSRHAKYKHLTTRPHSCPYCLYNNVEKTKVRLHVLSHHPKLPKFVKTDKLLLDQMTNEAKRFYVRCFTSKKAFEKNLSKIIEETPSHTPAPIVVNPNYIIDEDNEEAEKITENSFSDEDEFTNDDLGNVSENGDVLNGVDEVMNVKENEGVLNEIKTEKEDGTVVSIEDMGDYEDMIKTEMKEENFEEINKHVDETDFNGLFGLTEDGTIEKNEALEEFLESIKEEDCGPQVPNENVLKKELPNIIETSKEGMVVERMNEGNIENNSTMSSELNIEKGIKLKIKRIDTPTQEEKSVEVFKDVIKPNTSFKIPKRDISILRRKKKTTVNNSTKFFESVQKNVSPNITDNKLIDSGKEDSLSETDTLIDVGVDDVLNENKKEDEVMHENLSKKDDNKSYMMNVHIVKSPIKIARMIEGVSLREKNSSEMFGEILKEKFNISVDVKKSVKIDNDVLKDPKISKMHPVVRLSRIKRFPRHKP